MDSVDSVVPKALSAFVLTGNMDEFSLFLRIQCKKNFPNSNDKKLVCSDYGGFLSIHRASGRGKNICCFLSDKFDKIVEKCMHEFSVHRGKKCQK